MKYTTEQFKEKLKLDSDLPNGEKEKRNVKGEVHVYYYGIRNRNVYTAKFFINNALECETVGPIRGNIYRYNEYKDKLQIYTNWKWNDVKEAGDDVYFDSPVDAEIYKKYYIEDHKKEYCDAIREAIEIKKIRINEFNKGLKALQELLVKEQALIEDETKATA